MPELVNISADAPNAVPIWAFHGPCTVKDVAAALGTIGSKLSGQGWTINIMSGTHGYCTGQVGAPATREQKFADEDRSLASPKTEDGKVVAVNVIDFNTGANEFGVDPRAAAMKALNDTIRKFGSNSQNLFLLAYCCSAGTK